MKKGSLMSDSLYAKSLVSIQFLSMGLMLLFSDGIFHHPLALLIFMLGLSIGIWALLHNRLGNFNIQPKLKENAKLITTGIYAHIRHPMYFSVFLMMLGLVIATPTLYEIFFFALLLAALYLKAKKEEALWIEENADYVAYKQRTKYFIPFVL